MRTRFLVAVVFPLFLAAAAPAPLVIGRPGWQTENDPALYRELAAQK